MLLIKEYVLSLIEKNQHNIAWKYNKSFKTDLLNKILDFSVW